MLVPLWVNEIFNQLQICIRNHFFSVLKKEASVDDFVAKNGYFLSKCIIHVFAIENIHHIKNTLRNKES